MGFIGCCRVGTVSALTLAGCSAASAEAAEPSNGESLRIVLGSNPQASQIPLLYGVGHYGGDFGLAKSVEQNVTKFDSHADAAKTLLDGKAQIMGTSFSAILDTREQGENVKIFCPYVNATTSSWPAPTASTPSVSCSSRPPGWASIAPAAPAPLSSTRC